jgi:hypothetical protein
MSSGSALARVTAVDREVFARDHWSRAPLLTRAKELPDPFDDLLSDDAIDQLIADRALRRPFFRTVKGGGALPSPVRTARAGSRSVTDLVDPEALRQQYADGATLVLQSLHRLHPPVATLCRDLAAELGHPTQCNAYVTPGGGARGFDFHHDTHDVFVLQVSGRKRWVVHEPVTRLPLRSQTAVGAHLVPDGAEPLLDVELEAGDCLYLPRGFVHAAVTTDEHSVHLTVGVVATTWFDVLTDALALAGEDERFRGALPLSPGAGDLDLAGLLQDAAGFLAALPPEQVAERVRTRLARAVPLEPIGVLTSAAAVRDLAPDTVVRPRRGLAVRVESGDPVTLTVPGKVVSLPAVTYDAVQRAVSTPSPVADLAVGGLDVDDALVLARRLLREGVLVAATP